MKLYATTPLHTKALKPSEPFQKARVSPKPRLSAEILLSIPARNFARRLKVALVLHISNISRPQRLLKPTLRRPDLIISTFKKRHNIDHLWISIVNKLTLKTNISNRDLKFN